MVFHASVKGDFYEKLGESKRKGTHAIDRSAKGEGAEQKRGNTCRPASREGRGKRGGKDQEGSRNSREVTIILRDNRTRAR